MSVIESDAAVRGSLQLLLRSADLPCRAFETLQAFLDEPRPQPGGCLIWDVSRGLPAVSLNERAAAVILTCTHREPRIPEALGARVIAVLPKPFTGSHLLSVVQEALADHAPVRVIPRNGYAVEKAMTEGGE